MNLNRHLFAGLIVLACLLPADAAPPGQRLLDEVAVAYDSARRYEATLTFRVNQKLGRWHNQQTADMYVALDRDAPTGTAVKIDKPDFYVVVKDGKFFFSSRHFPGKHVEQAAPAPLDYDTLMRAVTLNGQPLLADPVLIDLAFLLAADPIDAISQGAVSAATPLNPDPTDPQKRPRLEFGVQGGKATLSIDPASKLVTAAVIEMSPQMMAPGDHLRFEYVYDITAYNTPLSVDAFAFDTSTPAEPSLLALASGGGGGGHPLIGRKAPPIELKTLDDEDFVLDDVEAEVIVIDFWASWCPPCRVGLPMIQSLADWAEENDLPVAVYTVNVGEDAEVARAFWEEQGFTMPVILDLSGELSINDYGAQGIPQTVIIKDGTVVNVHSGLTDEEVLRAEVEALLAPEAVDAGP